MKISFRKSILILLISIALGITFNSLNPDGIDFIRKERVLIFEKDTLLSLNPDSASLKLNSDSSKIREDIQEAKSENKIDTLANTQNLNEQNQISGKNHQQIKKEAEFKEPKAITIDQAYKLFKQGVVFIDARESEEYTDDHILNAISIPFYEYDENAFKLNSIKKDQPIVVYCAGSDCDLSILLGDQLFEMGYKNTYIFFGGWNEWLDAKYPTEKIIKPDLSKSN